MPKLEDARTIYHDVRDRCLALFNEGKKRKDQLTYDQWRNRSKSSAYGIIGEMRAQIEAENFNRAGLQRLVADYAKNFWGKNYAPCWAPIAGWPNGVDAREIPRVDEIFFVAPIERIRVRVLLFQDRAHVVGGASVVIDAAAAVTTGANGLTDLRTLDAGGRHRIRVTLPAMHAGNYVECQCDPCRGGTPRRYLPRGDAEYVIADLVGADQTVDVYVDQLVRIKLGYPGENSVPGTDTVDRSWVMFYLPETKGAAQNQGSGYWSWFGMTTNQGSLDYFGTDPGGARVRQGANFDLVLGARAGAWHFARVMGGVAGPAAVSARLVEQAYAREGRGYDAAPLIPWKFYFWPTGTGSNTTSQEPATDSVVFSPIWAYDVWVGGDPTTADSAFGWESNPLNTHHDTEGDWSGHCNQAATASIIFQEPANGFDHQWDDGGGRHLQLDSEGLKILATEFAGHRVRVETLFTVFENMIPEFSILVMAKNKAMDSGGYRHYLSADGNHLYQENGTEVTGGQVQTVRDAATLNKPRQVEAYGAFDFTTWEQYQAARDTWANVSAARLIKELNTVNVNTLARRFPERGAYAARMFAAMQAEVGVAGLPLLTDVRAPAGGGGASNQVWNQAIYFYQAFYREHPQAPATDAEERRSQDLEVTLRVYWNEDYQPTYDHATATIVDHGGGVFTVTPRSMDGRGLSLYRNMRLRLQFSNGGRLDPAEGRNNIETSTGHNNSAFFLLRYLQKITAVTAGTVSTDGNPFVNDTALTLEQPPGTRLLQLRNRFPIT